MGLLIGLSAPEVSADKHGKPAYYQVLLMTGALFSRGEHPLFLSLSGSG